MAHFSSRPPDRLAAAAFFRPLGGLGCPHPTSSLLLFFLGALAIWCSPSVPPHCHRHSPDKIFACLIPFSICFSKYLDWHSECATFAGQLGQPANINVNWGVRQFPVYLQIPRWKPKPCGGAPCITPPYLLLGLTSFIDSSIHPRSLYWFLTLF